jgi:hypothetical protein
MRMLQPVRTFIVGSLVATAGNLGGARARSRSRRARARAKAGEECAGRLGVLAVSAAVFVSAPVLVGCGGSDSEPAGRADAATGTSAASSTPTAASAPAREWTRGYPDSITVLGHSGSTGESSDPDQPGVEVRENSWATGSNPEVDSLYLRILKHNPGIKGHNMPYSEGGADVRALAGQADRLLDSDAKPDLIVIQIMDNDLTCPVDRDALAGFSKQLSATLKKLAHGAPNSSEFVVSQFGSVPTYATSLSRDERASQGGTGPCDFMTPTGSVPPAKVARAEQAIHAYEAALAAACKTAPRCTYDGAFGHIVDRRDYIAADLNHFSIHGHAKAAAVAWAAMRRAHVLPRAR